MVIEEIVPSVDELIFMKVERVVEKFPYLDRRL